MRSGSRVAICVAAVVLWIVAIVEAYLGPLHAGLYWLSGHISPAMGRLYIGESDNLFLLLFILTVSPITISRSRSASRCWARRGSACRSSATSRIRPTCCTFRCSLRSRWSRHITPLTPEFFENPLALVLFYVALIGLGLLSYNFFERPMQTPVAQKRHVADRLGSFGEN